MNEFCQRLGLLLYRGSTVVLLFDTLITIGIWPRPSILLNDPFLNCLFPRLVVIRKVLLYQTISLFLEIREQSNLSGTFPPKILIKLYYARSPLQWLLIIFFWCDRSVDANKSSVLDDFFSDSFPYQGKNNIRKLIVKYYPLISTAYIARFLSHNVCYTPTLNKAH